MPPNWARKITGKQLKFRGISSWEYGYWWIEWGGQVNTISDNERIRFELLSIVLGVWDYIKNSGKHPTAANWALDWVGMLPGKREARRLVGDHMLTQQDLMGLNGEIEDAVCIGGWNIDEHPSTGFDDPEKPPFVSIALRGVYNIPLRSLYSKNIANLMMAGRNISATHAAFTSTRVMATCAVEGQAVGTAAALCVGQDLLPRQLFADKARLARAAANAAAQRSNDQGTEERRPGRPGPAGHGDCLGRRSQIAGRQCDRWLCPQPGRRVASLGGAARRPTGPGSNWPGREPVRLAQIQLTFDSGFQRELTLSASEGVNRHVIRAPQPETVKDYVIQYRPAAGADWIDLARVEGNHQRLCRHQFEPVEAAAVRRHGAWRPTATRWPGFSKSAATAESSNRNN